MKTNLATTAKNHPYNHFYMLTYAIRGGLGREMFTKFRFGSRSKQFGSRCFKRTKRVLSPLTN